MVSVLISGSSSRGSSPGQGHCVVFLGKTLILDWHPIQGGSRNTPRCFMQQKPEISARLMHHLAPMQTLPVKSQFR